MRKHGFAIGEYYHIYNRGTEKRDIILDSFDLNRFIKSLTEFNSLQPIGSIYEQSFLKKDKLGNPITKSQKLVSIIAYCINPNHFHLILTPLAEKGIERYMQRMTGYTRYFNEKYKRNGVLFQGKFKSKHVPDNNYLLRLGAYVNMNNRNRLGTPTTKLSKSSLEEYSEKAKGICKCDLLSGQFKSGKEYLEFALEAWGDTLEKKAMLEF